MDRCAGPAGIAGYACSVRPIPDISPGRLEIQSTQFFLLNIPGILAKYKVLPAFAERAPGRNIRANDRFVASIPRFPFFRLPPLSPET